MSFFSDYAQDAQSASQQTGVYPSTILAQWAWETGYGGSYAFTHGNNFAGISYSGVSSFSSKAAGLSAYIQVLNHSTYNSVRSAVGGGTYEQAKALGRSPWAAEHYDHPDWVRAGEPQDPGAWTPANPGTDLIGVINNYNLTQYDHGAPIAGAPNPSAATTFPNLPVGQSIKIPPLGMQSDIAHGDFYINGQSLDIALRSTLVTCQMDLDISKACTLTLTFSDPDALILQSGIFSQKSVVTFGAYYFGFVLVSVEKQAGVITATFESYTVNALRNATGPFTVAPGQMTRTDFATLLIQQVEGASIWTPPFSYLYAQDAGYARATQEIISRGTVQNPLEDSWTCLQRIAQEIQFVCFECLGIVYFGSYEWLVTQPPVMYPVEGYAGINTISGTYDVGQPDGQLQITADAGSWLAQIGDCINIQLLGPYDGNWIVSSVSRQNVEESEISITCMQPQPSLKEPTVGGAQPAVGAGYTASNAAGQQSQGGSQQAQQALAFAEAQLGKPYVWGGEDPRTGFDCSGLVQAAYASAGVSIPRTTYTQWASNIAKVPVGIQSLRPGDLVYFAGGDGSLNNPGHVAIVHDTNLGTNTVNVIDAYETGVPIRHDSFGYVQPGGQTNFAGAYTGAIRPAP